MHALVRYGLWLRRLIERLPGGHERISSGFEEMPEVRQVLESHLNVRRDPSLAIRSIYGQWFPWLVLLDREWADEHVGRIFPSESDLAQFRDVAWETYIAFCAPYDSVLTVLRDQYAHAIERIGSLSPARRLADPEQRLAEHLMVFYWRGKLALAEPAGLLERFYQRAPDLLRAHAIQFIGRSLSETQGALEPEIAQRLRVLWERRMQIARSAPTEFAKELGSFGWWFASGKLEEGWAIERLEESLRLGGTVEPAQEMAGRLAGLAEHFPLQAVRSLAKLIEADREGWGIFGWKQSARTILAIGVRCGDREARDLATSLVHQLGERGHLEFRDLVIPSS